jgi:hypothetical protein
MFQVAVAMVPVKAQEALGERPAHCGFVDFLFFHIVDS